MPAARDGNSDRAQLVAELKRLRNCGLPQYLPWAGDVPIAAGELRHSPEDFQVSESTGIELVDCGEHVWIRVRKRDQNTRWVAQRLAEFAHIPYRQVSYAGLKDRHAVAEQTFSLHLPGKPMPDWDRLEIPGVEVLESAWHNRKLRQGQLSLNHFRIVVRHCQRLDPADVDERVQRIREQGVPNYFGAQRFGIRAGNLDKVLEQPDLRRLPRAQRSFSLSALRAALYNGYLSRRVRDRSWCEPLEGEALMSDRPRGSAEADCSVFRPERLPTGLLWGRGCRGSTGAALQTEQLWYQSFPVLTGILERAGVRCSRRVLRARVGELSASCTAGTLEVAMTLGPGVFATSVLRELLDFYDVAGADTPDVDED